jgi:hypothetical protein
MVGMNFVIKLAFTIMVAFTIIAWTYSLASSAFLHPCASFVDFLAYSLAFLYLLYFLPFVAFLL